MNQLFLGTLINNFLFSFFSYIFIPIVLETNMVVYIRMKKKSVPKWVWKAHNHWLSKIGHRPYDMTKVFTGKTFCYKVHYTTIEQGIVDSGKWWKRRRLKSFFR
jgi:hypothetical protein